MGPITPADTPIGPVTDKLTREPMAPGNPKLVGSTDKDKTWPRHDARLGTTCRMGATTDRFTKLVGLRQPPLLHNSDKLCKPVVVRGSEVIAPSPKADRLPTGQRPVNDNALPTRPVTVEGRVGPKSAVRLTGMVRLATWLPATAAVSVRFEPPAGKPDTEMTPSGPITPAETPIGPVTDKLTNEPKAPGRPKLVGSTVSDSGWPVQINGALVIAFSIGATTERLSRFGRPIQVPLLQSSDRLCTPRAEVEMGILPKRGSPGKPNVVPTGHSPDSDKVLPKSAVNVLGVVGVAGNGSTDTGKGILATCVPATLTLTVSVVVPEDNPDIVRTPVAGLSAETVVFTGPLTPTDTKGLVKSMPVGIKESESGLPTQTGAS